MYHVMGRGNGGQPIFLSDEDRLVFLGLLDDVARKTGATVMFLCLMTNHFHLFVKVAEIPLSVVMQRFLCRYSRYFNRSHGRKGHLFQSRFKGKLCANDAYLKTLIVYIHKNPVKDGLAGTAESWVWSSHHQYLGPIHSTLIDVDAGLALLDSDPNVARRVYAALMNMSVDAFTPKYDADLDDRPKPAKARRPSALDEIASAVEDELQVRFVRPAAGGRSRLVSRARRAFAGRAMSLGHPASAVARFLGVHPSAVTKYARAQ